MDQEPKKEYESPKMNVVELSTGVALLECSGEGCIDMDPGNTDIPYQEIDTHLD